MILNSKRISSYVVAIGFCLVVALPSAKAQVDLIVADGTGTVFIGQGVDQQISLFLESNTLTALSGANLIVSANDPSDIPVSFDATGSVFIEGLPLIAPLIEPQDLNIATFNPTIIDGVGLLGTLLLDSSSLALGTSFEIDFAGTFITGDTGQALQTLPAPVTVSLPRLGDFDFDGDVDVDDLDQYSGNIGATPAGVLERLDLDSDGDIDFDDMNQHYTQLVETSNGAVGTFAGDADLDGDVDIIDAQGGDGFTFVQNIGTTSGAKWSGGDFDGDGDVDIIDSAPFVGDGFLFVSNLGNSNSGGSAAATSVAVPEPSGMSLLCWGTLALVGSRRR